MKLRHLPSFCVVTTQFQNWLALLGGLLLGISPLIASAQSVATTISGNGVAPPNSLPAAQLSTTSLQFGTIAFGSTETLPLTITNVGGGTLTISPSINGQSFIITGSTCEAGVTAGNSCTLQVEFSPVKAIPHNDILTLATNGSANPTVKLTGVALGVSVGTELLQFGTIPFGSSEVLTVTITNTAASGTVAIGAIVTGRPNYKILTTAQNTCQAKLPAGQSCTLPIQFEPEAVGLYDNFLNLTISADGPPTAFVRLDGIASPAPTLPQTENILYQFTGNTAGGTDGWGPNGGVVMDSQGNLYGTTQNGPIAGENLGTVFKLSPLGQETILYRFGYIPDGWYPNGGLVLDAQGNLYGTTQTGGAGSYCNFSTSSCYFAAGTAFKIAPDGTETLLHSFASPGSPSANTDGMRPQQGLTMDSQGNLYGTTTAGGNSTGCGTVFEVTPGGSESVLYSFSGPDGCDPGAILSGLSNGGPGLVMDANRNLYGTTALGGANGWGTVFKLGADGTETVLHSFAKDGIDGYEPNEGLALDSEGNLYGTTSYGGLFVFGTIFKITPSGTESILFNFNGNSLYSVQPGLLLDTHQNLYGTVSGDEEFPGVVFQFAPSGVLTILYEFPGYPEAYDGSYPQGGLLLAANGSLFGTTSGGDPSNSGTVFELSPSINPTAAPVFSVSPGTYTSPQTITITDATPGATIYYTVNYVIASSYSGTFYRGPVTISSSAVLSAIAVAPDGTASDPIMANYVITSAP